MSELNVYRERAILLSGLATFQNACIAPAPDAEPGFKYILYIETPEGQLSWHIADADLDLFAHVFRARSHEWDGHTTEEKYARYLRWRARVNDLPFSIVIDPSIPLGEIRFVQNGEVIASIVNIGDPE